MTREEEIRQRLEAATPGPWESSKWMVGAYVRGVLQVVVYTANNQRSRTPENQANAELIANAPADLQYLLDKVSRLEAVKEEYRGLWGHVPIGQQEVAKERLARSRAAIASLTKDAPDHA